MLATQNQSSDAVPLEKPRINVVVLGDHNVGKTNLLQVFKQGDSAGGYASYTPATVGIDYICQEMRPSGGAAN